MWSLFRIPRLVAPVGLESMYVLHNYRAYELESKLLKGGYIGDYIGDYYRGYSGGY